MKIKHETDLKDLPDAVLRKLDKFLAHEFTAPYRRRGLKGEIQISGGCVWKIMRDCNYEMAERFKK